MTLYEMSAAAQELLAMLEEEMIDEQTFTDTLEGMGALEKVEGYCQVLANLNADINAVKGEIDRLTTKKKSLESNVKWLKGQLLNFYINNGGTKISAGTFTVSTRKSEAVEIINEDALPDEYKIIKTTVSPDKTAIKKAIKGGIAVSGAELVVNENIQVK